jgi:hypothetical protein
MGGKVMSRMRLCWPGMLPVAERFAWQSRCAHRSRHGTQASSPQASGEESPADRPTTVFPHSETSRFWVSGQMNFIEQWHPSFHSPYQGPLSLTSQGEHALSRVFTLVRADELGRSALPTRECGRKRDWQWLRSRRIYESGCRSQSFPGSRPYVGRTMLHFAIPLSH